MAQRPKNIMEYIAEDFLNRTLSVRFDICTCDICRNDMLAYILSRIPARYATTELGELHTIIEQTRIEHQAEIGRAVIMAIQVISRNPRHQVMEDKDITLKLLLDKIHEDRGLDLRHYRQELLKRRLALRIGANNLKSYAEYLRLLIKKPEEYENLLDVLCINVSEFFRDAEVWVTIKYLLENIIRQKRKNNDKTLKIWSAGCATGEEAYSIAILLKEILRDDIQNFSIDFSATDIDQKCLKDILKAEYQKDQLKNVDGKYLKKYFLPLRGGNYKLQEEIKKMVKSLYLDLTSEDLIENTDIIFCRNVFIYYSRSLQEQILTKFYKSLKPKGYLILGKVETILNEAKNVFEEIDSNAHIYQKKVSL